jgi:hypothetical protein
MVGVRRLGRILRAAAADAAGLSFYALLVVVGLPLVIVAGAVGLVTIGAYRLLVATRL